MVVESEEQFWEVVEGEEKGFSGGRNGGHLIGIPFQCELCHMGNIEDKKLMTMYERLLILIRRENMDTFWVIEPSTVG